MPELLDIARVGVRGAELPGELDGADEIVVAAWHLHHAVLGFAQREEGLDEEHEGVAGYLWQGSLTQIFYFLWPAGQTPIDGLEARRARWPLQRWLYSTGNLIQMQPHQRAGIDPVTGRAIPSEDPVWWVRRQFTRDGPPAPARKQGAPVTQRTGGHPCREPGCGRSFPDASLRLLHEDQAHAASSYRKWHCGLCPDRFYSAQSMSGHLRKRHHLSAAEQEYQALMRQAEEGIAYAEAGVTPLDIPRPVPVVIEPEPEPDLTLAVPSPEPGLPAYRVPAGLNGYAVRVEAAMQTLSDLAEEVGRLQEYPAGDIITAKLQAENEELRAQNADLRKQLKKMEHDREKEREQFRRNLMARAGFGG